MEHALDEGAPAPSGGITTETAVLLLVAAAAALTAFARVKWFRWQAGIGPHLRVPTAYLLVAFASALVVGVGAATVMRDWLAANPPQAASDGTSEHWGALRSSVLIAGVGLCAQGAWLVLLAAVARVRGHHGASPASVHSLPLGWGQSTALTGAVNVLGWPVLLTASAAATLVESLWSGPAPRVGHATLEAMEQAGARDPWWWASAGVAVVLAPVMEEAIYRGCLQQALRRALFGHMARIVFTSVVFALLHWGALAEGARLSGMVTLGLFGVLLGYLYERTGRLSMCIATHALFNAINLARL